MVGDRSGYALIGCVGLSATIPLLEPTVEGAEEDPSTLDFSLSTLTEIN
jgi:hypothetical protein